MTNAQSTAILLSQEYDGESLNESQKRWLYLARESQDRVGSWQYTYAKRCVDLVGSLMMICLFTIPGMLIAIAILFTSNGPLFYREERLGRNGVPFRIWKFRTMYVRSQHVCAMRTGSDMGRSLEARIHKSRNDARITPVGRLLRQWSLDELPQLFNVLAGEMSLVGPRPIVRAEAIEYGRRLHYYLKATPGLSGLWQVSGRSMIHYAERTRLDESYVRRWNLMEDFRILLRTIPAVLGRVGAW